MALPGASTLSVGDVRAGSGQPLECLLRTQVARLEQVNLKLLD